MSSKKNNEKRIKPKMPKEASARKKSTSEKVAASTSELSIESENLAMLVTLLHYRHELTISEIGERIGKNASYLSKLCDQALRAGWLKHTFIGPQETELEARIISLTGQRLRHVRVVATPSWINEAHALFSNGSLSASEGTNESLAKETDSSQTSKAEVEKRFLQERENLLGHALAERLDSILSDLERESPGTLTATIAIGGSHAIYSSIQHIRPRARNVRIVPTSLAQVTGRVPRANSQLVATLLASRLGALPPEYTPDSPPEGSKENGGPWEANSSTASPVQSGNLFLAWLGQPIQYTLADFVPWRAQWEQKLDKIHAVWKEATIVIAGANILRPNQLHVYKDIHTNLETLGVKSANLPRKDVIGTLANRYISRFGQLVRLDEVLSESDKLAYGKPIPDIEALEFVMPTDYIKKVASRPVDPKEKWGHSILVCGGEQGRPAASAVYGGLANTLICDREGAEEFIVAWREVIQDARDQELQGR